MVTQKKINEIVGRIVAHYQTDKIILFGSYAYGNPTRDSDVDLLIIKDDKLPQRERSRIVRRYLRDIVIPLDIIVRTNNEFARYKNVIGTYLYPANKYGKVIYEKKESNF